MMVLGIPWLLFLIGSDLGSSIDVQVLYSLPFGILPKLSPALLKLKEYAGVEPPGREGGEILLAVGFGL